MTISFNNQIIEVEDQMVLSNFVFHQLGEKQNGVAVAINGEVKPKASWGETQLCANDEVLLIKATQGG